MLQQIMLFGPCYLGSKGLQHAKEKGPAKGKASWELWMFEKANFGQSFILFLMGLLKTNKHMSVKDAQKHFGGVFEQHAKIFKKKSK